jgi:hypothetical protein
MAIAETATVAAVARTAKVLTMGVTSCVWMNFDANVVPATQVPLSVLNKG